MRKKILEESEVRAQAHKDLAAICIIGVLAFFLASILDAREGLEKWASQQRIWTQWQVDEIFIVFAVLVCALGVFLSRCYRDLRRDVIRRKFLEERAKRFNVELERSVAERTSKLERSYKNLQIEISERERIEGDLRSSEERYRNVVDHIGVGVSLISPQMEILSLNDQMKRWFTDIDVTKKPICYKAFNSPPRENVCSYCPTCKTLEDGDVHESVTNTPQGDQVRNYRVISTPIKDQDGEVIAAIEMVDDITERTRAAKELKKTKEELERRVEERTAELLMANELLQEEIAERNQAQIALQDREETLKLSLKAAAAGTWDWSVADYKINWSDEHYLLFGLTREIGAICYQDWLMKVLHEDSERVDQTVKSAVEQNEELDIEYRVVWPDGSIRWIHTKGESFHDELGKMQRMVGISIDVTERKSAERSLEKERSLLRTLVDHLPHEIFVKDRQSHFVLVNQATLVNKRLNSFDEVLGKTDSDFCPGSEAELRYETEQNIMNTGLPSIDGESVSEGQDGDRRWYVSTKVPVRDNQGDIVGLVGINRDITESKRAEELLKQSEKRYRLVVDAAPDVIFTVSVEDGTIESLNHAFESTTGSSSSEWIGKPFTSLLHPDDLSFVAERYEMLANRETPSPCRLRIRSKSGKHLIGEFTSVPLVDKGKVVEVLEVARDITERVQTEERLLKINRCFLEFGTDPDENINSLTALFGELMGATCALYNRLEKGMLCSVGQWNTPSDYSSEDDPDGHICYDVIRRGVDEVYVLHDLHQTEYAETDPNVAAYKLKTYVGYPVRNCGAVVGSLCVLYKDDFCPTGEDKGLIKILASAVGVEEDRRRAEQEISDWKCRYELIVASSGQVVYDYDIESGCIVWGGGIQRVLGYSLEEMTGGIDQWAEMIHSEDRAEALRLLEVSERNAAPYDVEYRFRHRGGDYVWMRDRGFFVTDPTGKAVRMLGTMQDVTERRLVLESLKQSEERYRAVVEQTAEGIYLADAETKKVMEVNTAFRNLLGYREEEVLALRIYDIVAHDRENVDDRVSQLVSDNRPIFGERQYRCKDGSILDMETSVSLVDLGGKKMLCTVVHDITQRKRLDETLRDSRARLQLQMDRMPIGCIVWSPDFRVQSWNPAAEQMFGLTAGEALGKHPCDLIVPSDPQGYVETIWHSLLEGDETAHSVNENTTKDGRTIICDWSNTPLKEANGTVMGVLSMVEDITERKRAEEALCSSEELYRLITENSGDVIYVTDQVGNFVYVSPSIMGALGYTPRELIASSSFGLIHPDDNKSAMDAFRGALFSKEGRTIEFRCRHKDGGWRIFESVWSWVFNGEHDPQKAVVVSRDITQRKEVEGALRKSEERYRTLIQNQGEGIGIVDREEQFIFVNPAAEKIFGVPEGGLIGRNLREFTDTEQFTVVRAETEKRLRGEKSTHEFDIILPDKERRSLLVTATPQYDENGEFVGSFGVFRDITGRKHAEALESALYRISEKANTAEDMQELYAGIHGIIAELMYAKNFYIAVHNKSAQLLSFPYFVDEFDPPPETRELKRGLTEYVIRTGEPLLCPEVAFVELVQKGEVESIGAPSVDWLGVPLKDGGEVFGVVAIQSYTENIRFGSKEKDLLTFVSHHIANALERRRAAEALCASEELYRSLVETSPDAITLTDLDCGVIMCNRQAALLHGYESSEEMVGVNTFNLIALGDRERALENAGKVLAAGSLRNVNYNLLRRDGIGFPAEMSVSVIPDDQGKPKAFIAVVKDITERKQAEEELKYRADLEALVSGISSNFINLEPEDIDSGIILALQAIGEFTRVDRGHVFLFSADGTKTVNTHEWCAEGIKSQIEVNKDLRTDDFSWFKEQLVQGDGFRISEIAELPEEARTERDTMKGHEIKSLVVVPLVYGGTLIGFMSLVSVREKRKWSDSVTTLLKLAAEVFANALEHKRVEESLRLSEEKYRTLFEESKDVVFISTPEGTFADINPVGVELFGYSSKEELLQVHVRDLYVVPDSREDFLRSIDEKGYVKDYESILKRKDGQRIIVLETTTAIRDGTGRVLGYRGIIRDVTEQRQAEEVRLRLEQRFHIVWDESADGLRLTDEQGSMVMVNNAFSKLVGKPRQDLEGEPISAIYGREQQESTLFEYQERFANHLVPQHLEGEITLWSGKKGWFEVSNSFLEIEGQPTLLLSTFRDVTQRKRLEAQLLQVQKMESIGTLAGGIAHDFNNVLMAIQGNAELMERRVDGNERLRQHTVAIKQAAQRGADLTKRLLAFARLETYKMRPLIVNHVLEETIRLLEHTFQKSIEIDTDLSGSIPFIDGDQGQLQQVFINICVNARDAMPQGGTLKIATHHVNPDRVGIDILPDQASLGGYVEICISDTGVGMGEQTQQHIFEPFFTTKERGKGTGLGLAVAYGIVQSHKGFISVESQVGVGSTFRVYLPVCRGDIQFEAPMTKHERPGGSETILVVDDEEVVLDVSDDLLTGLGYRVIKAGSGEEAVSIYRNKQEEINLVVLDMAMPKMDGEETFRQLKEMNPNIKVLIASGLMEREHSDRMSERGIAGFLQKPYRLDSLAQAIREVLDHNGYSAN
jgi:PAS domain S-box-containing protein